MSLEFNFHELKAAGRLPSPSGSALRIMQLVQQDDTTVQGLAEAVKTDPALTARILSFANSAAFGAHRPIVNVAEAVQMMGMQAVRNFALGLSLIGNNRKGGCQEFDYSGYWMKSLAMAVAVSAITARERTVAPEEAFTLGLLSDVGQLALATAWPDIFGECLRSAAGEALLNLECERFAIDHKALTVMLLQDWGIPGFFLDALTLSFEPLRAEANRSVRFAGQVGLARQLAQFLVADDPQRDDLLPGLRQMARAYNFDGEALNALIDDVGAQWHGWGKLIDIKTDARLAVPASAGEHHAEALPGLDILLVDDDPLLLARLSKQLGAAGHRVESCRDGESALRHVLEHKHQVIITDWRMKPVDGLSLCKTLRATEIGKKLYIIMLTAAETEDELVEAFDAGIDDYVTKPVNLKILLARIRAGQRISCLQQEIEKEKQDIQRYNAELAVANRRLSIMANTDALTGLSNRRYALIRLKQEWEAAVRYNRPLSVLMLDLDHFKSVNDSLGHDAGDVVLTHAAKLMKAVARTTDVACRFGGEEFLIIATNTDGKTALLLAERIRSAIETHQPRDIAIPRPITVSIGVAGAIGHKPGWNELIKMADQALYAVKAGGRNASRLASSGG